MSDSDSPSKPPLTLEELRRKIDATDASIVELLDQRARLAQEIGRVKRQNAGNAQLPKFYDPERERSVLSRLGSHPSTVFPQTAIPFVFREIISACRSLETELKVAFLGPAGTYSQIAASQVFGSSVQYLDAATIEGVFSAVERGLSEYGVVPIENSYEGGVPQTLDSLLDTDLFVRGEVVLRITHCLVGHSKGEPIRRIYSHPQALGQCRQWLTHHFPDAERVPTKSTSAAARLAAAEAGAAAIGSRLSAELNALEILVEGIEDQKDNATRFVVLGSEEAAPTGADKTSLALQAKDAGALAKILRVFEEAGVAIGRLESRNSRRGQWQYAYFIDFPGHHQDLTVKNLLEGLKPLCETLRVLGSYRFDATPRTAEIERANSLLKRRMEIKK